MPRAQNHCGHRECSHHSCATAAHQDGSCIGRALSWERPQRGCSQEACRQQSQGDNKRIKTKVQSNWCCDQRNPTQHEACLLEASHSLLEVPWHHGLNSSCCWKGSPALVGGLSCQKGHSSSFIKNNLGITRSHLRAGCISRLILQRGSCASVYTKILSSSPCEFAACHKVQPSQHHPHGCEGQPAVMGLWQMALLRVE